MQKIATQIIKHYRLIIGIVILLFPFALLAQLTTRINYDLVDYLPKSSPSTLAIHQLKAEFGSGIPNLTILLPPASPPDILNAKNKLQELPFIQSILWLDDAYDLNKPLELAPESLRHHFYQERQARFLVAAQTTNSLSYLKTLREQMPEGTAFAGPFVDLATAQENAVAEVRKIFIFILPVSLFILMIATKSYLEPFLLLLTILFGVSLNLITNLFLSNISYITNAVAPILQMAVSMDYAIFFLHTYQKKRDCKFNVDTALIQTIPEAGKAIFASSLTTIFGFLSLLFMQFGIGSDLGFVLAKGVFFSLLSVLIFLPSLIRAAATLLEKTKHRSFLPHSKWLSHISFRLRLPILLLTAALLLPAFLAQRQNQFHYSMDNKDPNQTAYLDAQKITSLYGETQQLALLIPRGQVQKEIQLSTELLALTQNSPLKEVISYQSQVSPTLPSEALPEDKKSIFFSKNFSRIILEADLSSESEASFQLTKKIREIAQAYYPDAYYLAGEPVSVYDMKATVEKDIRIVNGLAILSIGLVICLTFRSLFISLLLLFTIEISIWLNLAFPYFQTTQLSFVGFLVISTVQLGATVDYGILFVQVYLSKRKSLGKKEAILATIQETFPSLLPPALILIAAGLALYHLSSLSVVNELGLVLARGTAFSLFFVLTLLPVLLYYADRLLRINPLLKPYLGGKHEQK